MLVYGGIPLCLLIGLAQRKCKLSLIFTTEGHFTWSKVPRDVGLLPSPGNWETPFDVNISKRWLSAPGLKNGQEVFKRIYISKGQRKKLQVLKRKPSEAREVTTPSQEAGLKFNQTGKDLLGHLDAWKFSTMLWSHLMLIQ